MAAVYTSQYAPVSDGETGSGAPLSVRAARDLADSMNNAKRYAMVDKVLSHIAPVGVPSWDGITDITTSEQVMMVFAPRFIPRGFSSLRFFMSHIRDSGAGQTTWRLYSMPKQYVGLRSISAAMLPVGSMNASIITSNSSYNVSTNTVSIVRGYADESWLMVTAENNIDSSWSKFATLDAWPVM